ncbi:hypothetical protein BOX15_Mlig032152g1 [Macrostomum lignano]|uniref:Uncharacterized protein n=1 Tax=Macrostomum lignano TaxID=282301 RepID=A0A267DYP2_9PLAT|nr:hypothetical protein BOX15_Mlig032152g1 [Macrostomum lignano]
MTTWRWCETITHGSCRCTLASKSRWKEPMSPGTSTCSTLEDIYADLDAVCQKNFEHLLNSTAMLFGGMDGLNQEDSLLRTYVENSLMASRPGHPFWMRLIARVMVNQHFGRGGDSGLYHRA